MITTREGQVRAGITSGLNHNHRQKKRKIHEKKGEKDRVGFRPGEWAALLEKKKDLKKDKKRHFRFR